MSGSNLDLSETPPSLLLLFLVSSGMLYLHRRGIVHRDLKSSNGEHSEINFCQILTVILYAVVLTSEWVAKVVTALG